HAPGRTLTVLPVFTGDEMRRLDERAIRDLGIPGATLMENAERGAAEAALAWLAGAKRSPRGRRVVVVCGKGGNGGDGFVLARHLARRGLRCDVVIAGAPDEIRGAAAQKLRELRKAGLRPVPITDAAPLVPLLARADLVVDALLGTGARGVADGRIG